MSEDQDRKDGLAVWLFAAGQTLNYAGLYYAFSALLPDLIAGTGWGVDALAFGPTISFLVMAALLPFTGRLLDHGHGAVMMVAGPVLGGLALLGLGAAQALWQWYALWALVGLAMAGSVYETCFALLTRILDARAGSIAGHEKVQGALPRQGAMTARAGIIRVTLVAGFASTLSFPLGHWLGPILGGQGALMAFAGVALMAAPLNWAGAALLGPDRAAAGHHAAPVRGALRGALRKPAFWGLTALLSAMGASHAILMTFVLVLFEDRGAGAGLAALAASCVGPAQVLGRLMLLAGGARVSNGAATFFSVGALVAASAVLMAAGAAPALIFAFAALQGAGAGLFSILRPVLTADLLGRAGFGTISSVVALGPTLANAAAPALGALMLRWGGASMIYAACLALCVLAFILALMLIAPHKSAQRTAP